MWSKRARVCHHCWRDFCTVVDYLVRKLGDAVHVQSPAGCTARRLQGDALHTSVNNQPVPMAAAAGLSAATKCLSISHLSPQPFRWHAQPIVQWLSQPKCHITISQVLNNWINRPNTACKYEIYCSFFVCHMIYRCNLRYSLLVEAYFVIMLFSLGSHNEHNKEVAVFYDITLWRQSYTTHTWLKLESARCQESRPAVGQHNSKTTKQRAVVHSSNTDTCRI